MVILAVHIGALRMKHACEFIIRDLKEKEAFDIYTAVDLAYAQHQLLRFGLRDFKPQALQALVSCGVIRQTGRGRFYLNRKAQYAVVQERRARPATG